VLVKEQPAPPQYSPIVLEDEKHIVYETHPIYESIEITDRDFRESRLNEKLKFKISGLESQIAIIDIYPGQKIKSETDKVVYMTSGIKMNTIIGGFMSSFKRLFTGSTLYITEYYYKYDKGFGRVAFAENFPSKIIPIRFSDYNGAIICQKGAFLCGTDDIEIDLEYSKSLKSTLFGGSYLLQKLKGTGTCLIHAGGSLIRKRLRVKEKIRVSVGLIVCFEASVKYEKEFISSVKNMIGAGSVTFCTLTGPGDVFIESMHFEDLVNEIVDNINTGSTLRHERGTISKDAENELIIKALEEQKMEKETKDKKEKELKEAEENAKKEKEKKKKDEEIIQSEKSVFESIAKIEEVLEQQKAKLEVIENLKLENEKKNSDNKQQEDANILSENLREEIRKNKSKE
jgi:uncharacterized protein (TIGR00266 family)